MKIEKPVRIEGYNIYELSEDVSLLIQRSREACKQAYAPHSEFKVGASVLLDDGQILCGSNQENAAYPSGLCAERTLLFHLGHSQPERRVLKMAISALSSKYALPDLLSPCGACLQVMSEQGLRQNSDFEIWMQGKGDLYYRASGISQLLPFRFLLEKE